MAKQPEIPHTAQRVINFIERYCTHTKGSYAGRPFILPQFQKDWIIKSFGPTRSDGTRSVTLDYWEVPKKNGKSELCAALALYGLIADKEASPEVYIAAAAQKQATKMFAVAAQMVRNNAKLDSLCRIYESTKTIMVKGKPLHTLKAVAADADTEDGANPSMVLFDELHRQKTRDLWDVFRRGMSTRIQPKMVAITTAGIESESPLCWEMHDYTRKVLDGVFINPNFCPILYSLDIEEDWKDQRNWLKVNPAMDPAQCYPLEPFKRLDSVREEFDEVMRLPSQEPGFRRLHLDQWTQSEIRWIPLSEWDKPAMRQPIDKQALVGLNCFGGLDLAAVNDLVAFVLVFPLPNGQIIILPKFWVPSEGLAEKVERTKVPYDQWAAQDYLTVVPGKIVDQRKIKEDILALAQVYRIHSVNYDPWQNHQLATELGEMGLTMVKFTQTIKNYSPVCKTFEKLVLQPDRLVHGGHPVLRWNLDCTDVKMNSFEEKCPVKPDRQTTSKRIDGVVGTLMGMDRWERAMADYLNLDAFIKNPVMTGRRANG